MMLVDYYQTFGMLCSGYQAETKHGSIVGGFQPFFLRRNEAEWLIFTHFEADLIIIHVFLCRINYSCNQVIIIHAI